MHSWRLEIQGDVMTFGTGQPLARRTVLQLGGSALGAFAFRPASASAIETAHAPVKRVIIFALTGGPAQHETWDPKPDAPKEVRDEFDTWLTTLPGGDDGPLADHIDRMVSALLNGADAGAAVAR